MISEGAETFGFDVADEKRRLVEVCIFNYLSQYPLHGIRNAGQHFLHYPVSNTPFTVIYEFDDDELRVLFIVHQRQDRRLLNPADVEW